MRSRSLAAAVIGLAALVIATTSSASPTGIAAQNCVPKTNIEAIIDDSGSMIITDSDNLRLRAMELFIDFPGNEKKTLGAIQFGGTASRIFAPGVIGDGAAMKSLLGPAIGADEGQTDYNAAFDLAGQENPNATARIFLTDGQHDAPDGRPYLDGHRSGPPVYVIGLGVFGDAETLLQRIASESGGLYRAATANDLQSTMVSMNTAISCFTAPVTIKRNFTAQGQQRPGAVRIPSGVGNVTASLSWSDQEDRFDIVGIKVVRGGKTVAASKVRKLKITRRRGATFETVKIARLVRGKLKFKLRATRLVGGGTTQLTTQIVHKRKR